jgi:hypothetical protein
MLNAELTQSFLSCVEYIIPRRRCSWVWWAGRGAGSSPRVGGPGGAVHAPTVAAPAPAAAA